MTLKRRLALGLAALLACAAPAAAQLPGAIGLPGVGGALPSGLPAGLGSPIGEPVRARPLKQRPLEVTGQTVSGLLVGTYEAASHRLLAQHPDVIEPDDHGQPVVRGEILALDVDPTALRRLRQAGYSVRSRERLPGLGLETVVLGAPRGLSTTEAIRRLHELDPDGQYDFNHLYLESGGVDASTRALGAATVSAAAPSRVGLVDGSVATGHPALVGARLMQRPFALGGAVATAHATAVASLIVEAAGGPRGATLYVADIYGATPSGGSAVALSRGLAWLADARVPVINVSLVGPPNLLLAAAIKALVARGHLVVAPVGNDGPAAPPLYPAAYPGVVAVTGVDRLRHVLPEAGRGTHVNFAAPGVDLAAALDRGLVTVRGTSFAAPIAAGLLARRLSAPDPAAAAEALAALGQEAVDLGAPGPDPVYGRGLVGADVRVGPAASTAKSARK
jgi:hypothetical protein